MENIGNTTEGGKQRTSQKSQLGFLLSCKAIDYPMKMAAVC